MSQGDNPGDDFNNNDGQTRSEGGGAIPLRPLSEVDEAALNEFLLAPVPRQNLSPAIRRAVRPNWMVYGMLFLGAVFTFMGLLFVVLFLPWRFWYDWRLDLAHGEGAGRVISMTKTQVSINNVPVYEYKFEFSPADAVEPVQGSCYITGMRWATGDDVRIWYVQNNPAIARIEDSRSAKTSMVDLFVLVFPLVGLGLLYFALRVLLRRRWLMVNGAVGEFRVIEVVDSGVEINDQIRYRAECRRVDDTTDEARYDFASHHGGKVEYMRNLQQTSRVAFGLYDPRERAKKRRAVELPEAWFR